MTSEVSSRQEGAGKFGGRESGQEALNTEGRRIAIRMSNSRRAPSSAWDTNQSGGH